MRRFISFFIVLALLCAAFASVFANGIPNTPALILSKGILSESDMTAIISANNKLIDGELAGEIAALYRREAAAEGVNHDIAFSQMCFETDFLSFKSAKSAVSIDSNNFGGIGAKDVRFSSIEEGIRAHIQHLKAYATKTPPVKAIVDPRYYNVRLGSSPRLSGLSGKWHLDKTYGEKIAGVLDGIYTLAFGSRENGASLSQAR